MRQRQSSDRKDEGWGVKVSMLEKSDLLAEPASAGAPVRRTRLWQAGLRAGRQVLWHARVQCLNCMIK